MPHDQKIARMIRVNHAGEYGAKRIYQGQLSVLGNSDVGDTIREMQDHEQEHLEYFENAIVNRRVRPTALLPVWHVAGFVLGAATARLGKEAAMACTVAVEEVIEEHYRDQMDQLHGDEKDLKKNIQKFCDDEIHHRDIGLAHNAEQTPGYELLTAGVKAGSRLAIWLSKRF